MMCELVGRHHSWRLPQKYAVSPETTSGSVRPGDTINTKRARFKAYRALAKAGAVIEAKESKVAYKDAIRVAKHAVSIANCRI